MKSKIRLMKMIMFVGYIAVWALGIVLYWCGVSPTDAMGFSVFYLWLALPVATFAVGLLVGKNGVFARKRWFLTLFFGAMHMLAEYMTFSLSNMIAFEKINMPDLIMLLSGAAISAVGMGVGLLIDWIKRRKGQSEVAR